MATENSWDDIFADAENPDNNANGNNLDNANKNDDDINTNNVNNLDEDDEGQSKGGTQNNNGAGDGGEGGDNANAGGDGGDGGDGGEGGDGADKGGKAGKDGDGADKDDIKTANLTGIEMFLSQYGIEGGIIQFEDGSTSHFNDLDDKKQAEILNQLQENPSKAIAEKYELDGNEIGLINYLRTNKLTIDDLVNNIVNERLQSYKSIQESNTIDFEKMGDDAIYAAFLKTSNPDIKEEELEEELEKAKTLSTYKNQVEAYRKQFKAQQEQLKVQEKQNELQQLKDEIEQDRQAVVQAVMPLKDIAGIELNDNVKNEVLDSILHVNEDGDSLFMEEVFGDPVKLFNAAFWYNYGSQLLKERDAYWKKEKSAAYKRGREDVLKGDTTGAVSFIDKDKRQNRNNNNNNNNERGHNPTDMRSPTVLEDDFIIGEE